MTGKQQNDQPQSENIPSPFSQLVMMLATSALQHLGQLPDPVSQKREVNLPGAQAAIDLLEALNEKTRGNLDEEEAHILSETLSSLRLHYVRRANAPGAQPPSEPEPEPSDQTASAPESGPAIETPSPGKDDDEKRKYHKSYG